MIRKKKMNLTLISAKFIFPKCLLQANMGNNSFVSFKESIPQDVFVSSTTSVEKPKLLSKDIYCMGCKIVTPQEYSFESMSQAFIENIQVYKRLFVRPEDESILKAFEEIEKINKNRTTQDADIAKLKHIIIQQLQGQGVFLDDEFDKGNIDKTELTNKIETLNILYEDLTSHKTIQQYHETKEKLSKVSEKEKKHIERQLQNLEQTLKIEEDLWKTLNIDAGFCGNLAMAKLIQEALYDIKNANAPLPSRIRSSKYMKKLGRVYCFDNSSSWILFNEKASYWAKPKEYMKFEFKNKLAPSSNKKHVIYHEIEHFNQDEREKRKRILVNNFTRDEQSIIERKVSKLAATNDHEFGAEVFAALMDGRTFDKDDKERWVMERYKAMDGTVPILSTSKHAK